MRASLVRTSSTLRGASSGSPSSLVSLETGDRTQRQFDLDPAVAQRGQLCRDDLDVPVHCERRQWVELTETALREGGEIQPQLGVFLALRKRLAHDDSCAALRSARLGGD